MLGLPSPLDELPAVEFVAGNTIPAFEDLLAGIVVPSRLIRVVDPPSIREVARLSRVPSAGSRAPSELEARAVRSRRNGGLSNGGEDGEDRNEASEREKRKEWNFPCRLVLVLRVFS